ncbi:putative membrane protein [Collimonas arenae]|uniref:Putative membrane protein n=1 Tax=Collimonas arenae TaxID=279058 RepID=A0A127PUQ4_9BURK|nr:hypothetical protein [Collimonas arenae]AMP01513.1 putative membrane protein [Collimonas arenae]AMP11410.1 putative membrane protein [Collimonas arenae]
MKRVQILLTIAVMVGLIIFIFAPAIFAMSPTFFKWWESHPVLSHLPILLLLLLGFAWGEITVRQNLP